MDDKGAKFFCRLNPLYRLLVTAQKLSDHFYESNSTWTEEVCEDVKHIHNQYAWEILLLEQ